MNRRKFIKGSAIATFTAGSLVKTLTANTSNPVPKPLVVSTWDFGRKANWLTWKELMKGARAVNALVAGVGVVEQDVLNNSVGIGGLPDRDGVVTLDACVMDEFGNAGAVAALENIVHPAQIARLVMEKTPHVLLVGAGALDFARSQGFKEKNLLTPLAEKSYIKWLETANYNPIINIENHDTIGSIAMDTFGNLGGVCTTSGLAYKMHGRVGDSPIIGAGLYVDNEVGAATATGIGELVLKNLSTFLCVELMRNGMDPQKACEVAIKRILKRVAEPLKVQVGLLAINRDGKIGAYSIQNGFTYAFRDGERDEIKNAEYAIHNPKSG